MLIKPAPRNYLEKLLAPPTKYPSEEIGVHRFTHSDSFLWPQACGTFSIVDIVNVQTVGHTSLQISCLSAVLPQFVEETSCWSNSRNNFKQTSQPFSSGRWVTSHALKHTIIKSIRKMFAMKLIHFFKF